MSLPPHHGAPALGERLGPYRIVSRLGQGGMGTVYEAVDETLHRRIALKVIAPAVAGDPDFRRRFVREAQAQASLDSSHVVQVFSHGEIDGQLYIASQLIPDGDLGAMLRQHGPPPPQLGVELITQVADGLAEAHRSGLVHRDIKPANVLLRKRGPDTVAYLADFGIARQVGPDHSQTQGLVAAGTPSYMAPELHLGVAAGPASDVYSLGCLLWATLTGTAPYGGTSNHAIVDAHVSAPVPQLPGRSAFDREVNRILRTALAKDPAARYPSAAAFRDELRSLSGAASTSRGRRTGLIATAVIGVLVLVAAVAVVLLLTTRDDPSADDDRRGDTRGSTDTASGPVRFGSGSEEEQAVDNIATALEDQGEVDAQGARCIAQQLIDKHGVDGLQEKGLLDDDLKLVEDSSGDVDPKVLADIFTTAFSCIMSTATP